MKSIKVLLVEDNLADVAFFRAMILDIKNHTIDLDVANDLAEAIRLANSGHPDVIFLDLGLPDCVGIETIDRMIKEVAATPIIVFTGSQALDGGVSAVQRGAQDFLVKGFVSGDLLEKTMLYAVERFNYELIRQELEQARVELAIIANTKSRFLSNVSHELSTPLTAAMGYLQLLSSSQTISTQDRGIVGKALDASKNLQGVISNVIEASRVEMKEISLTSEAVQIGPELALIKDRFRPLCEAKDLDFEVQVHGLHRLSVDIAKLRFVMNSLLENAIRFTEVGSVKLTLDHRGHEVLLIVSDTGSGIEPGQQARLFDSFHHDIDYLLSEGRGAGLSLYICKSYIDAMGGALWVESDGAKGTRFTASIPLDQTECTENLDVSSAAASA